MSISATSISEMPLGAIDDGTPSIAKKVPPKRTVQAVADVSATPEPR